MQRIVQLTVLADYRLELRFADGTHGVADVSHRAGRGVFAAWNDYDCFRQARIGDHGGLVWPGELDLCADALYLQVTDRQPEEVFPRLVGSMTHA